MFPSPVPSVYHIHKTKQIGEVSILPFVSLWGSTVMYGLLSGDIFPLFITCAIGQVFALLFLAVYFYHTPEKAYARRMIGAVAAFVLVLIVYAVLGRLGVTDQSHYQVGQWVGYVGVCVSLILNASPFESIRHVVKVKSASSIPILLCLAGAVSNTIWVAYGIVVDDLVVAIPNAVCIAFGVVPITLYAIYNPHRCSRKQHLLPVLLYSYLDMNAFPVLTTAAFGVLAAMAYIAAYFRWTSERRYVVKLCCAVLFGLLLVTIYVALGVLGMADQTREQVRDVVGFLAVGVSIVPYASPLETVKQVVRTKSAKTLPISMCFAAAVNCSLWVVCGAVGRDLFMLTPNAIGVTLPVIQITLYFVYNPKRQAEAQAEVDHKLGLATALDSTRSKDGSQFSLIHSPKDAFSPVPVRQDRRRPQPRD